MKIQIRSTIYMDLAIGVLLVLTTSQEILPYAPINHFSQFLLFLVFPGHLLLISIYPRKIGPNELITFYGNTSRYPSGVERIILVIFSSLALSSVAGLLVTYFFDVKMYFIGSLQLLNLVLILFTAIRAIQIQEKELYFWEITFEAPSMSGLSNYELSLMAFLIIILGYSISLFTPVISSIGEPEEFTEFYILGPDVLATDYPTDIERGDTLSIFLGIENHESLNETYSLQISKSKLTGSTGNIHSDSRESFEIELDEEFLIMSGQKLLIPFSTTIDSPGFWVLEFDLFIASNDYDSLPYRELQLNVEVV